MRRPPHRGPVLAMASCHGRGSGRPIPRGDDVLGRTLRANGFLVEHTIWSDERVDWGRYAAVLVRSCWDYHLQPAAFLAWLDRLERRGVTVLNPPAVIRWNMDKRYLRALAAAGVPIPETEWIGEGECADVAAICRRKGWAKAVAKPVISASAYRTELRNDGEVQGPLMVQRFVEEIEGDGEWSLLYFAGSYSHAVRKIPRPGDFLVQREFGGRLVRATPSAGVRALAETVMRQLPGAVPLARVDVVVSAERGPLLMEVELIEPELFLSTLECARRAAGAIAQQLREVHGLEVSKWRERIGEQLIS